MTNLASLLSCALLLLAATPAAAKVTQPPVEPAVRGKFTSQGCFSSLGSLAGDESESRDGSQMANSPQWCSHRCRKEKKPVAALHRNTCYCMDTYPPRASLVADSECAYPCPGHPIYACGGKDAKYSVYNIGAPGTVQHQKDPEEVSGGDASAPPEAVKEEL
jgi:cell wall integrity and stress response component